MDDTQKITNKIRSIDNRVEALEKINDIWMSKHGEMNKNVYSQIQQLMDERDILASLLIFN